MLTLMFGVRPEAKWLLMAATLLTLICLVAHIFRRRAEVACTADDTEAKLIKSRFRLSLHITLVVLLIVFMAASWTGQMTMQDLYHMIGIGLGTVIIGLAIVALANTLRAPGSFAVRLLMAPLMLVIAMLTAAATLNIHNVYMSSHGELPVWSWSSYEHTIVGTDYTFVTYMLAWLPAVLVIWGIVAIVRRFRNRGTATP